MMDASSLHNLPSRLNVYVPPQYQKDKAMEKDIMKEWRKLVSMTEVNAKYRYVQLCRSLKTWGITRYVFFILYIYICVCVCVCILLHR